MEFIMPNTGICGALKQRNYLACKFSIFPYTLNNAYWQLVNEQALC